mmetsp:Transcript_7665/g.8427  ORF Transcript_7665/g.8427 Transcript_7665/m.8427 type:complete len:315 (+) Transcript_7665:119-1063(+)
MSKRPSPPSSGPEAKKPRTNVTAPQLSNVKFRAESEDDDKTMILGVIDGPHVEPVDKPNKDQEEEESNDDEQPDSVNTYVVSLTIGGNVFNGVVKLNTEADFSKLHTKMTKTKRKYKKNKNNNIPKSDVPQMDLTGDDPQPLPSMSAATQEEFMNYQRCLQLYGNYNLPNVMEQFKRYFLVNQAAQGNADGQKAGEGDENKIPAGMLPMDVAQFRNMYHNMYPGMLNAFQQQFPGAQAYFNGAGTQQSKSPTKSSPTKPNVASPPISMSGKGLPLKQIVNYKQHLKGRGLVAVNEVLKREARQPPNEPSAMIVD